METEDDLGWSVGAQRGRQQCRPDPEKLVHWKDQPSRGADEGMGGNTNQLLLASFPYALRKAALRWLSGRATPRLSAYCDQTRPSLSEPRATARPSNLAFLL